jgi:hypothetical protein
MSPEQQRAVKMAREGIGSYKPYLQEAGNLYGSAKSAYNEVPGYARGALESAQEGQGAAQGYIRQARRGYGDVGEYASLAERQAMHGTRSYDPNSVTEYMNPYQQQVTANAVAEMNRQAAIQNQGVAAQAAKAGAFGGSRFGVQQAELGRNLADIQSQRIMQDYSQNYSQAQQAAMNAFANQQARLQNAGQISLGAGSLANQEASGLAGLGNMQYTMGMGVGQMGLNAGQLQNQYGASLANLGQSEAALGQQRQALQQGDTSFQWNMGQNLQAQNQRLLDAARMNQQLYNMEPYQRMSYYADLLNRTPSGQMGMSQTTAPSASPWSQMAGLGIAGLGAYNAYNNYGGGGYR